MFGFLSVAPYRLIIILGTFIEGTIHVDMLSCHSQEQPLNSGRDPEQRAHGKMSSLLETVGDNNVLWKTFIKNPLLDFNLNSAMTCFKPTVHG